MVNTEKLHIFPSAPDGASMFARYVAYHILATNSSVNFSKKLLFGTPSGRAIDPFGASIGKLIQVHPEFRASAVELLERATLFGFYSAALVSERRDAWRASLLDGQGRMINKFVTGQAGLRLVKQCLHFCEKCVKQDEDQFGIGFWRLTHQVPGIKVCPIHLAPLYGACKKCNRAIASENNWHAPSRKCPYCGNNTFQKLSGPDNLAFERFTALSNAVIEGETANLAPHQRIRVYSRYCPTTALGAIPDADLDNFINEVLKQWHMSTLEVLQGFLEVPMNREFVKQAICGQDHILNPVGHLALMAAFPSEPLLEHDDVKPVLPLSEKCRDVLRNHSIEESDVVERLGLVAVEHGLPTLVGIMLLEGATQRETFQRSGVCGARVGRFREALEHVVFTGVKQHGTGKRKAEQVRFGELVEEIRDANFFAYHGKAKRDSSTLGSVTFLPPQYKGRSIDAMRTLCREIISQALDAGVTARRELPFSALNWCRRHDREWLDLVMPRKKRPSIDVPAELFDKLSISQLRRLCRKVINEAVKAGVGERPTLPKRAEAWAKKHDEAWFRKLPPKKRWKPAG